MKLQVPRGQHRESGCIASGRSLPTLSVVICTRNRPHQLDECLKATRGGCYPDLDILVVENGIENEVTRRLSRKWGARYVNEPIVSLSRARNCGLRNCTSEIIAFTDDDAIPSRTWL